MWWMVLASSWNSVAQQCWRVPVTSQANPRVGLLGLPRFAGGIPPAAVAGVVTFKRRFSLTCFVESCATEPTFLLCLLKASLPPPKYHCKSIVRQPRIWYFFSLGGGCKTYIYILINLVFTSIKEKKIILMFVLQYIDNRRQFVSLCVYVLFVCVTNP